jgi:RNA polymerase sigma factor (sigma-70 family)
MSTSNVDPAPTSRTLLYDVREPGDHQAWEKFHARYAPMIRGWCQRWIPREADDMVQEVMGELVFIMRSYTYRPELGRFRGWLKTVTHRMMARLKRNAKRLLVNIEELDAAEASTDLWERLGAEYDLELLEKAKENIRDRVELRTWLAYVETAEQLRGPTEVAKELGMKVGAVYQAKYHVLTLLRQEVAFLEHSSGREVLS